MADLGYVPVEEDVPFRPLDDEMEKARSFGGDRSEAGRYAANIRWQRERDNANGITRTTEQKWLEGPKLEHGLDEEGLPRMLTADEARAAYGESLFEVMQELKRRGLDITSNRGLVNLNDPVTRGIVQGLADIADQFAGILAGTGYKISIQNDRLTRAAGEVFQDTKHMTLNAAVMEEIVHTAFGMVGKLFSDKQLDAAAQKIAYGVVIHELGHVLDAMAAERVPEQDRRLYRPYPFVTEEDARRTGEHMRWASISYIGHEGQQKYEDEFDRAPVGSVGWFQQYSTRNPAEQHAEAFTAWWLFSGYKGKRTDIPEVLGSLSIRGSDKSVKASLEFLKAAVISDTPEDLLALPVMRTWILMAVLGEKVRKARSFGGDRSEAGRYAANMRWAGHQTRETSADASGSRFTSPMDDDRFREKYGNERLSGDGDCFEAAAHLMLSRFADDPSARVCHGVPLGRGEIEGIRFDHGWVEVEEVVGTQPNGTEMREIMVYDFSNGGEIVIPRSLYYMLGNIAPDDVKRFTAQEAMGKMRETGFYGPWD